jgi:DNA repair exonuclease SbcCD ATPase subunit
MDHYRLSDELRQQLLENAAWGKAGLTRLDEKADCPSGDKDGGYEKPKKGKKSEKGMKPKMGKKDDDDGGDDKPEMAEEGVAHVCPLCTSHLDEALEEERVLEHLNVVVGLVERLTQLQEGEEDIDSVIDETLAELLFQDLEEE